MQALDNYWVVGSFAREANASREAERLSRVTGIDVSYKRFRNSGMIYYGVVTPASLSPAALQTLRDELAKDWRQGSLADELGARRISRRWTAGRRLRNPHE